MRMRARFAGRCLLPCVLVLVHAATAAQPGGLRHNRLFTTPAQRADLDAARNAVAEPAAPAPVATAPPPPPPRPPLPQVRVQGLVIRSRGPDTAWVNDASTLEGGLIEGNLRVETGAAPRGEARILLPDARSISIRPGQTWDPASGRVRGLEVLQAPRRLPAREP